MSGAQENPDMSDLSASKHTVVLENLSPNVRKRVEVLREVQSQHDELEAKFNEEREALATKYQKLYQPLYTKRYELVNGLVDFEGDKSKKSAADQEGDEAAVEKGIPRFWLNAMRNNPVLNKEITECDDGALKYLKDIKCSRVFEPKGFKIEFFFDTNPYFKNSVLTKIYHMIDEDEPILEKAIGTEIDWYPGKSLTQKILKKKPRGSKNAKPITKIEKCDSFFNFFSPPEVPEDEDDIDEDTEEELQNLIEHDYEIGSIIREKIIPHAVSWFTGEIEDEDTRYDEGFGYEDDDDEFDEDEEDDEEKDDYDDDEDDGKTKKKKTGRAPAADGQQGEKPPECKQQ